ncbi:MAG: hypothetical protein AVDCRST_MAG89-5168 [uncultured Gemmatimonadetes bacterium]|uniref:Metal-dependent hydrolase n=1 Tax=uncultured Gemmatimonadota bacterium TaxID=203437 RepID=A0A6J4N8T7_9BACT|nr:MAG: hypothetical protein AVDCRST_MAG89-5168 [uncultured Gemmatimonadota bacterium]
MLIGAGLAEVARSGMREPLPRWQAWAAGAGMAALPDVDIVLGIVLGRGGSYHGTFTHSLSAVVVWALIGYAAGGGRWAAVVGVGYASHLAADLLDESGPTNLMLGWPFSGQRPYSIGKLFPKVPVEGDGMADTALNVLRPESLALLAAQTAMAAGFFAVFVLLARSIRKRRERPAA